MEICTIEDANPGQVNLYPEGSFYPFIRRISRAPGCGLPIGSLASQVFSNVYMDQFDKYMVSLVGPDRYGRYVDDAYVVGADAATSPRGLCAA